MSGPVLSEIRVAANPAAWAAAGFSVASDRTLVGGVAIEFVEGDRGIVDWALTDVKAAGIDGLPTRPGVPPPAPEPPAHANGVTEIDHVVALTPQLERTIAALEDADIDLRRIREGETGMGTFRQAFFRVGPILEVVESADLESGAPACFWGITFTTADIDAAGELLGDKLGQIKEAVQPGRRIATVPKDAGLGLPVALISPQR